MSYDPISGLPIAQSVNPLTDYAVGVVQTVTGGLTSFTTYRVRLSNLVGPAGQNGTNGTNGSNGLPAQFLSVTANTLAPGSQATVALGGTGPSNYTLTFGLPQGQAGTGNVGTSGTPTAGSIPVFVSYTGGIATIANATASQIRTAAAAAASGVNSDITSLIGLTTPLSVGQGGTGGSTASAARTSLSAAASGGNSDITSLSGLTTALSVGQGGTGSATASGARTSLGAAASGANTDITSLSSPALGSATATTQAAADNSTKVATTAQVQAALAAIGSGSSPSLTDWRNGLVESAKTRSYIPMIGAAADGFFDQSGVDVANSVNASYDATNKLYTNLDSTTKLLLHFDGTNGATTTTDDLGHSITLAGGATLSTAQAKFGPSSLSLTTGQYASIASTTDLNFGNSNFTVEGWVYPTAYLNTANGAIIFASNASSFSSGALEITLVNGFLAAANFDINGSALFFTATTSQLALNAWSHVAVVRNGTTITFYVNGNSVGSFTSAANFNWCGLGVAYIGTQMWNASQYFPGYIDEFRAGNGAKYSGNFTPAASAFTISGALDLRSSTFSAGFTPTKGSVFLVVNPTSGTITPNTNLIASLSQNAGSTYTAMPLTLSGTTLAGYPIYESNGVTLGGAGTQPKWRVQTVGTTLGLQVRGIYFKEQ